MVNVSTQLSAKMEAPYGEYSVPIARAAAPPSLVGSRAGSGQQPLAPHPGPAALPGSRQRRHPQRLEMEAEKGSLINFYIIYTYVCIFSLPLCLAQRRRHVPEDAEGLLQGSQQKWKQFSQAVMCCPRTAASPSAKAGAARGTAGLWERARWAPASADALAEGRGRAGVRAGQVFQQGVWCPDERQPPASVVQSIGRREMPARPLSRAPQAAQRVPARGSPGPLLSLAVPDAKCQQMHLGGCVPPAWAVISPPLPSGRGQICPCHSIPAR